MVRQEKEITKNDLKKLEGNLAVMIKRSFDDVYRRLNGLNENDKKIIAKLEGVVYRREFETLEERVKYLEGLLAVGGKG